MSCTNQQKAIQNHSPTVTLLSDFLLSKISVLVRSRLSLAVLRHTPPSIAARSLELGCITWTHASTWSLDASTWTRGTMGEAPGTREILSSQGIESSWPTGATRSSSLPVACTLPKISSSPVLLRHPRSHQNLQGEHTNLPEPWKLTVSKRFLGASSGKLILLASQARVQPQQQASGKRIQAASSHKHASSR
jgi:hypothetical protein